MLWAFFDPLYLIICGPFLLLGLLTQLVVKGSFAKWSKVGTRSGMTGAQAARAVLREAGVEGVTVEQTGGFLSDHYDPRTKVVRLSPDVYNGRSVASLGVAAHESGHAIQHARAYLPLALRSVMVPMVTIGGNFFPLLFIGGFLVSMLSFQLGKMFVLAGFVGLSVAVLFALVTLPVEFDASFRAVKILRSSGMLTDGKEMLGAKSVLTSAALTYVSAAVSLIALLAYYAIRFGWMFTGGDD